MKTKEHKPGMELVKKYEKRLQLIRDESSKIIVGQEQVINSLLRALLCDGHVLLEGIPGIAKTLIVRTLAKVTGCDYSRIQFTADLLPTDLVGLTTYIKEKNEFRVNKGPVFANFVIADEINRSPPKCVLGDTEILTANGSLINIENIFSEYRGDLASREDNEEFYTLNKEIYIMSFDPKDKKIKPKKVKYLYRQLTNQPYYEIILKSGRSIKTSNIHPFFSIKDGNIYNLRANELKINDCVLVPKKIILETNDKLKYNEEVMNEVKIAKEEIFKRQKLYNEVQKLKNKKINYIKNTLGLDNKYANLAKSYLKRKPKYIDMKTDENSFIMLPKNYGVINKINMPSETNKELMHFFALLISEGNQKNGKFYLSMRDKNLVEYFIKLLKELFNINTRYYIDKRNGQYRVSLSSKPLEKLIYAMNYKINSNAKNKDIPNFIMKASNENVKEFLKMYYEGDGGVSRDCVKVTSKSKMVANKLSYLLLRFGLIARISYEYSKNNEGFGDYYYNLRFYGNDLNLFREKMGFISEDKNSKLEQCCGNVSLNKNDTIPFIHSKIRELRKNNNITHREFYEATRMHAHNIENPNNRFGISRYSLNLICNSLNGFEEIKEIILGDFYCDYVKSINIIYPEKDYYLYDFTIEDTHSFVAGFGGIISHNTQSALLEAMQERQVTIGTKTYPLPDPFFVMATQNPIESSGVYPLPEAQIDRFLFKTKIVYPKLNEENEILKKNITLQRFEEIKLEKVTNQNELIQMQDFVKKIYLSKEVENYVIRLVDATRNPGKYKINSGKYIEWGASPRGSIGLYIAGKAEALIQGSNFVTPVNIKTVAHDVLRHRLLLNYEGQAENIKTDDIITEVLEKVPIP